MNIGFLVPSLLALASLAFSVWNIIQGWSCQTIPRSDENNLGLYGSWDNPNCDIINDNGEKSKCLESEALYGTPSHCFNIQKWCMEVKGPFYVPLFKPLGIPIATFCGCFFFADSFHYGSILGLAIVGMGYYTVMWGQIRADETHIDHHHHDGTMDSSEDKVPLLEGDSQV
ncbi:unnamed protein product [Camellia sinensis]